MVSQTPKQRATELLAQLPDDATFDQIQPHLHAAEVIRKRITKSDDPAIEILTTEQAKTRLSKWLSD